MSRNRIRWIIGLMSISLLGLIAFQVYWISKIGQEKADEFNRNINATLAQVSSAIEEEEIVVFINRMKSIPHENEVITKEIFNNKENTQIILRFNEQVITELKKENKIQTTITKLASESIKWEDASSIELLGKEGNTFEFKIVRQFLSERDNLTDKIDEMAMEYAFREKGLKERLTGINLDSLITASLLSHGIKELNYTFSVIDIDTDSILLGHNNIKHNLESTYQAPLFKENLINQGGVLSLFVEEKTSYILKSIGLNVFLSLILIIILISTFSYTLYSILKQKKIAQIKADFINNMTHEFKTPIATISLAIDSMLHKDVKSNMDELDRFGDIIKKENLRMNTQIERLLEMALFDRQEFNLDLTKIDPNEVIIELKNDFEIKSNSPNCSINLNLIESDIKIIADRMHFYNAIRNLIDNGIKYSLDTFKIDISTKIEDGYLLIEVSDQGIGMNKETQKKIFDRFYRKTDGNLHTTKGFGLGLAYVKEIIEKMNGSLSVESVIETGSTFFIKIQLSNK